MSKFVNNLKKFLTQPQKGGSVLNEQRILIKSLRDTHLFRSLNGKEEEAVNVVDNRDVSQGKPNNKILITCEHASNDIKFMRPLDYEEELIRSQEFFDIGAADIAYSLTEQFRCMAVLGNFSKLFVDPSKPLVDSQLIRQNY